MGQRSSKKADMGPGRPRKRIKAVDLRRKLETAQRTGLLTLDGAGLRVLDDEVLAITNLRNLNLSANFFVRLPAGWSALGALRSLNLSYNSLEELPEDLAGCGKLEHLVLSQNELRTLPPALPGSLRTLRLDGNALTEVPRCLEALPVLEVVYLNDNSVRDIGEVVTTMPRLHTLELDGNALTEVPALVARCPRLRTLSLARNRISAARISADALRDSAVDRLVLTGNPVTKEQLHEVEGFDAFLQRRKAALDKAISSGLTDTDRSVCGLD